MTSPASPSGTTAPPPGGSKTLRRCIVISSPVSSIKFLSSWRTYSSQCERLHNTFILDCNCVLDLAFFVHRVGRHFDAGTPFADTCERTHDLGPIRAVANCSPATLV